MQISKKRVIAAAAMMLATSASWAFVPAVVYDQAGKFDKSFNEAAYTGAERFKKINRHRLPRSPDC